MYGCRGVANTSAVAPELDDAAEVEDGDVVAHRADDGEVVGDEHVRAVTGRGELADEVEDLRLHRHVER